MNANETLFVADDFFTLKTPPDWRDTNLVYEITGSPRCTSLPHTFAHTENIHVFGLKGSFAFEIEDKIYMLEQGDFLYIPAHSRYRFRCRQREVSKLHIYSQTNNVEDSWRAVAVQLKQKQRQ